MRIVRRSVGIILLLLIAALATATFSTYRASQHVPDFYTQALDLDAEHVTEASQELESAVTMLYSDAVNQDEWFARFSDRQINAWLAVELLEKYGEWISEDARDPRVKITPEGIAFAVRVDEGALRVVYSFQIDLYLSEPNVLAFKLREARAGRLPIPLASVVKEVTTTADNMEYPLRWKRDAGYPVALAPLHPQFDEESNELRIDKIELADGAIYLSGTTVPGDGSSCSPPGDTDADQEIAFQLRDHITRQR